MDQMKGIVGNEVKQPQWLGGSDTVRICGTVGLDVVRWCFQSGSHLLGVLLISSISTSSCYNVFKSLAFSFSLHQGLWELLETSLRRCALKKRDSAASVGGGTDASEAAVQVELLGSASS